MNYQHRKPAGPPGNPSKQRKAVLRMTMTTAFITTFMGSALNLSVPAMETEFRVSAAMVGWVVTAFTLSVAALSVPMGKIADSTGRRRVLLLGIGSFAFFSLCCAFSGSIRTVILFRVLQGVSASMIFATNNAILLSVFPKTEHGRVLGISVAATYTGLSAGPVIGGFLNGTFGWRSIFLVTCGISLAALGYAVAGAPRESAEKSGKGISDVPGNLLYITMITAILYGMSSLSVSPRGKWILGAGIVLMLLFGFRETRTADPVIRMSMFSRDAGFTLSNLAALLNYAATFAISYLVSIYLQVIMGYSSRTAGLILIFMPLVQAVFSPLMGRLSDRIPPYRLATGGMLLCVAGLALFSRLGTKTPLWYVIITLMLVGFGFALFSSPNTNAILSSVSGAEYSVANSILSTMRTAGQGAAMAIVTIVVGMQLGNAALTETTPRLLVLTLHRCFLIFIVLSVIGVFFSMKRGGASRRKQEETTEGEEPWTE